MNSQTIAVDVLSSKVPRTVAALLAALHLREPNMNPLKRLGDHEWNSLLEFCDLVHLTLSLAQLPQEGFPLWVIERLRANVADNALRFERVKATYKEAAEALDRADIEHVVIKGFTQAPDYVPNPCLRAQSDLDLYCLPDTIDLARNSLEALGYKPNDNQDYTYADHDRTLVRQGNWQWRGNPFDPEMPLSIELHFCFWNAPVSHLPLIGIADFWKRRITRGINGFSFTSLSTVDQLGYLTLHILRNIFLRDAILHHVYELSVFLHRHAEDDAFWAAWTEIHDASLRTVEAIAFYYAKIWFGCDLHPEVKSTIESLPQLQQKWLDSFAASDIEGLSHMNKDFLWLQLSFLKSPEAKIRLIKRTLFPLPSTRMDSSVVQLASERATGSRELHPYLQYLVYLVSRSASHVRSSITTIVRGLLWRLSERQLPRQFWIFLGASFFLTLACLSTSSSSILF
jgi:hypothetical protein